MSRALLAQVQSVAIRRNNILDLRGVGLVVFDLLHNPTTGWIASDVGPVRVMD